MRPFLLLAAAVTSVSAHGYVDNATIAGQLYTFYQPYSDPYINPPVPRIARSIPGNGPVENVNLVDLQCNGWSAGGQVGSSPAQLHAPVAAGSTVNLRWTLWPDSHVGPSVTYMARCPDAGCQSWQPGSQAVWFKIQQQGREGTSSSWGASSLMVPGNRGVDYTIPGCLAPGYYLVRHELIALHSAYSYPGAQFYPGCHQLQVTGGGTTRPSNLVSFPGAYSGSDPGIRYDAYRPSTYTVPGPAVFTC
ncbi:glycoside hydrolase [Stachybotrys elegans]|uniref:lytic cellulose monooxygenase (C4-dehydrogenating) n=1 Tax=Stachybotrys elegans TaxID=80388 RepID=A0A8K0SHC5_9HYPO|nr:glycoside hydrolase [Stachybotrys elegans]